MNIIYIKKMNEDMINNINKRLDILESNYKLIKEENKEYEKRIQKNEDLIQNLNTLFKTLYKQINNIICSLKKDFNKKFEILQKKENYEEKNEIIINNKIEHNGNDLFNLDKIYEEMGKMMNKKLEEFEINLYESLGKQLNKKLVYKKEENKELKKASNKDDKKENIEKKEINLVEALENELIKIKCDNNLTIEIDDINHLKKISSALIIQKKGPLEIINQFFTTNYISNELEENKREDVGQKKAQIFIALQDLSLLKQIETNNKEEYIKQFRDKFGITEKDFDDKQLKILMKKYKKNDMEILKEILKKLEYIN